VARARSLEPLAVEGKGLMTSAEQYQPGGHAKPTAAAEAARRLREEYR
jgi:hypothetical protein